MGATGRIALWVQVTDISNRPCFLPSWPSIQLLDPSGKPLNIAYDYIFPNANPSHLPPTQESSPGEPILFGLNVDQSSQVFMLWGNWCQPAVLGGVTIRISLLGRIGWADIRTDIEGGGYCDDPSSPSTLDIAGFGY